MIDRDLLGELSRTFAAALDHDDPAKARRELLVAGWLDALDHDEAPAVATLFRLQGAKRTDVAALDDVIARRLPNQWSDPPGEVAVAYPAAEPGEGGDITHVVLPGHREARRLLWVPDNAGGGLSLLELNGDLAEQVVCGVDPELGLLGLTGRPAGDVAHLSHRGPPRWWSEALAAGRVALAHQLVAGAQALLDMTTAYAGVRRQFGQPIAAFQAVKHRLADTLVAVASADAATVAAATTPSSTAAAIAKVLAGRAAATAAKSCLQVFGGIGVTTEHELHRYVRRSLVLDRLLGDQRSLERELGKALRRGRLPHTRVVELDHVPRVDLLQPTPLGGDR